ncbi:MAG TPA: aminotransferase class I/II-fold pyridoxal phosphate-dependent enzyme, partial [Candidatus Omnitrophota bacterium]|nr:aminotransferase class I/II-fold pyridoxal phosphate-dependent enzyme [Candidatus Omnitrophota bacterium]
MSDPVFLCNILGKLHEQNLYRSLRPLEGAQQAHVVFEGQKVINFCSNNYLGLANDPRLLQAAHRALDEEGLGSGASRLICGNMASHQELENRLATFKQVEKALVFNSGYMANVGIISALCDREDIVLSDKLNHASIVDGILLSRAECRRYPHKDMKALEEMLSISQNYRKRLIVTDSVFSMDGDTAPLKEIVALAQKYGAMVMVDEAHGLGVLGEHG